MRAHCSGARCGGKFNKENKALEMFPSSMASPKKCHVCCCKSSLRWYSIVENIVEDFRNCFNVETTCNGACLCASCRWNLTRWQRSCDKEKEKYFVKAQSRGKAFVNRITLQSRSKGLRHFPEMTFFISYLFINTIFANPFPPKQCCGLGFLISGLSASRIKQLCNGGVRGGSRKSIKTQRSEN